MPLGCKQALWGPGSAESSESHIYRLWFLQRKGALQHVDGLQNTC